ncbi:hypothetical protein AM1_F0133 (plasmid) [Acaryochloris marina MBIC11017]|uniref:Uncharacterized protein n=1 Tax=Acaryochloris marina (strain MBIC 11017) TaxID=329726 RepID=A8ZPS6_ACAM1|nr:hypothetical protein AM1_F0133 [Acaryochloris marina MBIC11017]
MGSDERNEGRYLQAKYCLKKTVNRASKGYTFAVFLLRKVRKQN